MSKRRGQSPVIPWIGGTLIWMYMSILSHTLRWRVEGIENMRKLWDSPQGWVAATWHSLQIVHEDFAEAVLRVAGGAGWANFCHGHTVISKNR